MRSRQTPPPADPSPAAKSEHPTDLPHPAASEHPAGPPPPAGPEHPADPPPPAGPEHPAATHRADPSSRRIPLPPERRAELLAASNEADLVALADRCLEGAPGTWVSIEPTVGTIPFCVREPVVGERFVLADVLATHAEVEHRGQRGWAMRLGAARAAALAAAICDAELASGAGLAAEVDQLCRRTDQRCQQESAAEWAELSRTEVNFRELL
jgi:alpha-D-ribose 1-methylphosphonate 5-triphosphate synthase subunit PhnG